MRIDTAARCLEALGSATRLAIYRLLVRAGPDGRSVGEVQHALDIPASTLSHHLHRLVNVGLVTQERKSQTLICRAKFGVMQGLVDYLSKECCVDARSRRPKRTASSGQIAKNQAA